MMTTGIVGGMTVIMTIRGEIMKGRTTEKISKGKGSMKTTGNKRKREKGIGRRSKEVLKGNPCKAGKIVTTT